MNRRSRLEIDLSKLESNYRKIASAVSPSDLICVLKANAYGMGVKTYAKELHRLGCNHFGVADPAEAKELAAIFRRSKRVSVQILSSILPDEIPEMVSMGVVLPVVDEESARLISDSAAACGKKATVHFKVDTGMGRLGVRFENALDVLKNVSRLPNIDLEGVFSHFSSASKPDSAIAKVQLSMFRKFLSRAAGEGIFFRKIHMAASDAINNFPETAKAPFNIARVGLDLHGGFGASARILGLESVVGFKSKISQVRMLPKGAYIGYDSTFRLRKDSKIAVVAAGYADGVPLQLSNRGNVLVGGKSCPIVGRVSMDYMTVDVSGIGEIAPGDDVVLIGKSKDKEISLNQWAELKQTHPYDILTSFGNRVERVLFRSR